MPDYGGTVLWSINPDRVGPIDPKSLSLTRELKSALRAWAEAYDRTLNEEYPPESGFANAAEEEAFEMEGRRLWQELQTELGPEYKVVYFSQRDGRLYEQPTLRASP